MEKSIQPSDIVCTPFDFEVAEYCILQNISTRKDIIENVCRGISEALKSRVKSVGEADPKRVRGIILQGKKIAKRFGVQRREISREKIWSKLNDSDDFSDRGLAIALLQHMVPMQNIKNSINAALRLDAKKIPEHIFQSSLFNTDCLPYIDEKRKELTDLFDGETVWHFLKFSTVWFDGALWHAIVENEDINYVKLIHSLMTDFVERIGFGSRIEYKNMEERLIELQEKK